MANKRKFPDTILIILVILLVFIGLTWLIPSGRFETVLVDGREMIRPDSYHRVPQQPQGFGAFFTAPIRGFISAANIIGFVFLVGGAFSVLQRTGAIEAGLQQLIRYSQRHPSNKNVVVPVIIALFSLAGATFGMSEEVLIFVLITIPLALALGYDSITGTAISLVGAGVGFAGAFLNPFTVGIAQGIAELPPGSGMGYRFIVWILFTLAGIWYIMRYARRVERDPEQSPVRQIDQERSGSQQSEESPDLNPARIAILLLLAAAIGLLVIGVSYWGWYINEIAGLFVGLGMAAALVARMSAGKAIAAFQEGAKDMMTAALVIGLAKALIVIAEDGAIIDTMLNAMADSLENVPKAVSAELMFALQSCLNFFVPSGSGQAALTMPIMAPLGDLLGISRQTSVLAFQLGDGLSNMIIPTSGVTMGILAVAKIPYPIWFRWMLPLFLWLSLLAMLVLLPPILGWVNW